MNIEKLLNIAADSSRMPGWNDSLSLMLNKESLSIKALDDEQLSKVAGGVTPEQLDIEVIKKKLQEVLNSSD